MCMCIPNISSGKENISNTETTSSDFTLHRLNQHYPISPKCKEYKNFSSFHPHLTSGLTKLEPTRAYLSQKTPLEHPWPSNTSQINESKQCGKQTDGAMQHRNPLILIQIWNSNRFHKIRVNRTVLQTAKVRLRLSESVRG